MLSTADVVARRSSRLSGPRRRSCGQSSRSCPTPRGSTSCASRESSFQSMPTHGPEGILHPRLTLPCWMLCLQSALSFLPRRLWVLHSTLQYGTARDDCTLILSHTMQWLLAPWAHTHSVLASCRRAALSCSAPQLSFIHLPLCPSASAVPLCSVVSPVPLTLGLCVGCLSHPLRRHHTLLVPPTPILLRHFSFPHRRNSPLYLDNCQTFNAPLLTLLSSTWSLHSHVVPLFPAACSLPRAVGMQYLFFLHLSHCCPPRMLNALLPPSILLSPGMAALVSTRSAKWRSDPFAP